MSLSQVGPVCSDEHRKAGDDLVSAFAVAARRLQLWAKVE
jgi:hypothetical protein